MDRFSKKNGLLTCYRTNLRCGVIKFCEEFELSSCAVYYKLTYMSSLQARIVVDIGPRHCTSGGHPSLIYRPLRNARLIVCFFSDSNS